MTKILIADENATNNFDLSQFLSNDKRFIIENTYDGITTLNKYIEIKPDILILNSHFSDINYTEIIDRLCLLPDENEISNIILIVNNIEELSLLKNANKICTILKKSHTQNDIGTAVNLLASKMEMPKLTLKELNLYLMQLCFVSKSLCTDYMRSAIMECYHHPQSFSSLQHIFEIVAYQYNTNPKTVREGIRKSLIPLNNYRTFYTNNLILKIFDFKGDITPKVFLDKFVNYLRCIKNKK